MSNDVRASVGLEAASSRYVATGGLRLHLHDLGQGPPLVFVHGGGPGSSGWSDFGEIAVALARDFRCVVVDLAQYGRSDKPVITGSAPAFHARCLDALLEVLEIPQASFVCQSIGGLAALRLAVNAPGRVDRLVLNGTQPSSKASIFSRPMKGQLGPRIWREYYGGEGPTRSKMRSLLESYEWFDGSRVPEVTVDRRHQASIEPEVIAIARDLTSRGEPDDLMSDLSRVEARTLLVWGRHDVFGGLDVALMMTDILPHGELYVMPHAGHHPQEEVPEQYVAMVGAFLDSASRHEGGRIP